MSTKDTPDLIQKAAERMNRAEGGSLIEKAAKRFAQNGAATANPPAPRPAPVQPKPAPEAAAPASPKPAEAKAAPAPRQPAPQAAAEPAPRPAAPVARSPEPEDRDAENYVDLELVKMQLAGMVTPAGERSRILEEYRIIKRPLLLKALATGSDRLRNGNLIMVTSSQPREGKTFTAVNLAMSIASERDLNVLLVDADMHRAEAGHSAMSVLGVPMPRPGLLDVLADQKRDLADVLLRTNVPNLTLLPAGQPRPNPTELFASQRMDHVVTEMARRYADRIIVIDTPPVLAASEASVLAMHVGQIVFVVEAEETAQKNVETSLSMLSACPNISLVLNKATSDSAGDQFGSYAYGY
ncbi:MAG: XrtA-associated tyrosine autokinase [Alphaproteobacteria bacterium]